MTESTDDFKFEHMCPAKARPSTHQATSLKLQGQKISGLKRKQFSTKDEYNKPPSAQTNKKKVVESTIEIREDFQIIPPSQEEVLKTLLKNQNKILENQNKILENQKQMRERLEIVEKNMKENVVDNCVLMASSHTTRECKVILEKLHKSIIRLTGEDENELSIEIGATLPLASIDAAQDVEEKLEKPEYLQAMKSYLFQLKGGKGSVDDVFKKVMKDELISLFNFDGRKEKRALVQLTLINKLLSDVFAAEGRNSFEKELKKSVELSHNRFKQRKFAQKKI